jgi:hypothetical protein
VSKSLSIECDPVDQPDAIDPVERRTWSALRIRVSGRTVTRIWDKTLQQERSLIYLPTFPIAEWVVTNWWTLLNEPSPTVEVPKASARRLAWIRRHCLRSAESGLLLPALYLFNDGRGVRLEWQADERDALPNMPGEFVDSGFDHLENVETEDVLAEFVSEMIQRTDGLGDDRVEELKANWRAIRGVDADEAKFCVACGRLGVDPYDPSQVPGELAEFIEHALNDPDLPVARDLTEAAEADEVAAQWSWVQAASQQWNLGPIPNGPPIQPGAAGLSPSRYGYQLAAKVRGAAGLDASTPVSSVEKLAGKVSGALFRAADQNHVPGHKVRAVVGWTPDKEILLAGRTLPRNDSRRFLAARGLYQALFACDQSQRLVTDAFTWDQQASRAFAAELLAPRAALTAQAPDKVDPENVKELVKKFKVSTAVIKNQLENAGVTLVAEE